MQVTGVQVTKLNGDYSTKGIANITLDDQMVVKGLKIIEGSNGLFVAMPSKELNKPYVDKNGVTVKYEDIAFPITKEFRQEIIEKVMKEFKAEKNTKQF